MSNGLAEILRYFLLALIWLFFLYAMRTVIVEVRHSRADQLLMSDHGVSTSLSTEADARVRLRIIEPPEQRGRTLDLAGEVTFGRSPACSVALDHDSFASSVHARIVHVDDEPWLEDLGSTNGTYLNGDRINTSEQLRKGDRFQVGSTVFEVAR